MYSVFIGKLVSTTLANEICEYISHETLTGLCPQNNEYSIYILTQMYPNNIETQYGFKWTCNPTETRLRVQITAGKVRLYIMGVTTCAI